ncbi:hypothetical protein ACNKHL_01125 [Shigella flexneri]
MVTKRGDGLGICTLDDRRYEAAGSEILFTDALDKYQQLLEKNRILIVTRSALMTSAVGLK